MSHGATIVRSSEPAITREEWLAVVRNTPELILESETTPIASAYLAGYPRNRRIFWINGCVTTGETSESLIQVMFACARALHADVVGPSGAPYTSLDDWEKRTRRSREQQAKQIEQNRKCNRRERIAILLKVIAGLSLGLVAYLIVEWIRRMPNN